MTSIHSSLSGSHSGSSSSVHSVADTITSTAALTAAYRPPPKDYAAAFANLQAQYGMSGDFPGRVVAPTKKKQRKSAPLSGTPASGSTNPTSLARAPSLEPHPTDPSLASSEHVGAPGETSKTTPATGHESSLTAEGSEGEKGKFSGVSKLKRMLGFGKGALHTYFLFVALLTAV
ncbi:hypothetical protein B0H19DRAFT_1058785 [Mycena capillaripes]|nr:hypothetical protein B0H19DRAFT_1058785 [Mycena capillaripes]